MAEKVFINNNNVATFVCPKCQKTKTADMSRYKDLDKAVKVKCKCVCGHNYTAMLERRKYHRKHTNLPGKFIHLVSGKEAGKGLLTVTDLSRSGVQFKLNATPTFIVGDKLLVEFHLDDTQRSLIRKEVIVRKIQGSNIGAEFCSIEHYDRLGPYLLR